jgi:hypothetical protein
MNTHQKKEFQLQKADSFYNSAKGDMTAFGQRTKLFSALTNAELAGVKPFDCLLSKFKEEIVR